MWQVIWPLLPPPLAPLKAVLFWSLLGSVGPHKTGQHSFFFKSILRLENQWKNWTWTTSRATLEKFFIFQGPRLTPGLEHASDENPKLLSRIRTIQTSFLQGGLQDMLPLGSFHVFLSTQVPKLKEGERIQKQADLEKHHLLTAKDKSRSIWSCLWFSIQTLCKELEKAVGIPRKVTGTSASCGPCDFTRGAVVFDKLASTNWEPCVWDRQTLDVYYLWRLSWGRCCLTDRCARGSALPSVGDSFFLNCKQRNWTSWLLWAVKGSAFCSVSLTGV